MTINGRNSLSALKDKFASPSGRHMVSKDTPCVIVLKDYVTNTKTEKPAVVDNLIIMEGMITTEDIRKYSILNDEAKAKSRIWDKAIALYPRHIHSDYYDGASESGDGQVLYVDKLLLDYIYDSYYTKEVPKDQVYAILDDYIYGRLSDINKQSVSDFITNIYTKFINSGLSIGVSKSTDIRFNTDTSRNDRNKNSTVDLRSKFMDIYAYYLFNQIVLYGDVTIDPVLHMTKMANTLSTMNNFGLMNIGRGNNLDMFGIKDVVFKRLFMKYIVSNNWRGLPDGSGTPTDAIYQIGKELYKLIAIGDADIRATPKATSETKLIAAGKETIANGGNHPDAIYIKESLSIKLSEFDSRQFSRASIINRDATVKYFSEFMNVNLAKNEYEKCNDLAGDVDQVLILFEFMSNIFNKQDAMTRAYAVLKDIDKECHTAQTEDYRNTLGAIRKELTDAMERARQKDVKKERSTISINYPIGYEG